MRTLLAHFLLALILAPPPACRTGPASAREAMRPARIHHTVYIKLKDTTDAPRLIHDCNTALAALPGVIIAPAGPRLDTGRPAVAKDFDVGLYMAFIDQASYAAYEHNPAHTDLLRTWMPRAESIRIFDFS